jgi:L-threonylcarbamoyladenylate synthase
MGAASSAEAELQGADPSVKLLSPGQLKSHYAPRTPLALHPPGELERLTPGQNEGRLYFKSPDFKINSNSNYTDIAKLCILSKTGNMAEAAANLFDMLHELDHLGLSVIHAEEALAEGLGAAINDRLQRAAAKTMP